MERDIVVWHFEHRKLSTIEYIMKTLYGQYLQSLATHTI